MTFSESHPRNFSFERRLHYPWEYRRFFNQSQVIRLSECTIFRIQNELGHFRLGITLKARGSSIERNRIKRQLREFFRTHSSDLGSYDYNVVIPQTKKMSFLYAIRLKECLRGQFLNAIPKT